MGLSAYKIKKWVDMLIGNSVHHVNQDEGRVYSKLEIRGYYNNLTEKVSRFGLPGNEIPKSYVDTGEKVFFSIEIFQYGLGAYDLYLLTSDNEMLSKTLACADWAISSQNEDGSWETFTSEIPEHPYSSMAQGEGISLLLRAYNETKNNRYINAAIKAKTFMLIPTENGGTTRYDGDDVYLLEYTHAPLVLNGWIFSIWGLYDFCKFFNDEETKSILKATLFTLERRLPDFDIGYWSMYEAGKRICSPFYHKLHIAQLNVMYELTGKTIYKFYANKWNKYQNNSFYKKKAFLKKAIQKLFGD